MPTATATTAARVGEEIIYPDGRHELADDRAIRDSPLYNEDLAPVKVARRTWNTYNYTALWIGMAHNIPTYLLASGLVAIGMAWYQAIVTIALGNVIVLIPMLLNSHAGTKYGIPIRSLPGLPLASSALMWQPCFGPGWLAAGLGSRPGLAAVRSTC
jgi:NCS1 family nucleobase:cation symporter-1